MLQVHDKNYSRTILLPKTNQTLNTNYIYSGEKINKMKGEYSRREPQITGDKKCAVGQKNLQMPAHTELNLASISLCQFQVGGDGLYMKS